MGSIPTKGSIIMPLVKTTAVASFPRLALAGPGDSGNPFHNSIRIQRACDHSHITHLELLSDKQVDVMTRLQRQAKANGKAATP
jgi:hypothetical protein